jgi:hypothetical protein
MISFTTAQENLNQGRTHYVASCHSIQVMSEIQTNLSLNLYNLNSSWVDGGGVGVMWSIGDFKRLF